MGLHGRELEPTKWPGIYKRGTRYVVRVRIYDPETGRRREHKFSAKTLAEARAVLGEARTEPERLLAKRGRTVADSDDPTVSDYATYWLSTYQGRTEAGIRPETLAEYRKALEGVILPQIGHIKLRRLKTSHLTKLIADLKRVKATPKRKDEPTRYLSNNTIRNHMVPVRAMLATAMDEGVIPSNPSRGLRIGSSGPSRNIRALTTDEIAEIHAALSPRAQLIVDVIAVTGIRYSEGAALTWGDVQLGKDPSISIDKRRRGKSIDAPKTKRGRRVVPISRRLADRLQEVRDFRGAGDEEPIFLSSEGSPLTYSNFMRRDYRPIVQRLNEGRPVGKQMPTGLHAYRHAAATRLLEQQALSVAVVSRIIGHSSTSFTADVYGHMEITNVIRGEDMDPLS